MSKIKAIIFDMDGVLIDAKDWHFEALNKALSLFGFEISRYDHINTYDGLPTLKKLEMLSSEQGLPDALHGFINQMKQIYTMQIANARCSPLFIHEYALAKLKNEGFLLSVASNSVKDTVELMMKKSHLLPWLDLILSNQDVEKPKPNPEIYIKAAKMLGVKTKECLIIEDNHHGIEAAKSSGANVLEVKSVLDVTYFNIKKKLFDLEECK
jgi:beta-phosphoglucomutase